jgi:hypothetical protein
MESTSFTPIAPWLPPQQPDLARLAMDAADAAGVRELRAWPELRKGGIGFGDLPPFLSWQGGKEGGRHLVLVQPREVGALVPGARVASLPGGWLDGLDLESLARPLAYHPDFPGGASVHVVHLAGPGRAQVRTWGEPGLAIVRAVLERLTGVEGWHCAI